MRKPIFMSAFLSIAIAICSAIGCAPSDSSSGGGPLPDSIELSVRGAQSADGFLVIAGECNLPAGRRVLLTARGGQELGATTVENALVVVDGAGRFRHETLLSYPLGYAVFAEVSPQANPEIAPALTQLLGAAATAGIEGVETTDGDAKLVARAEFRIGTKQDERDLIDGSLSAIAERVRRIDSDREKIETALTSRSGNAATSAYVAWARIRADKARELDVTAPAIDPFFGELDLKTRDLWHTLDRVGLALLARSAGDVVEYKRLSDRLAKFDRDRARIEKALGEIDKGTAK